MMLDNDIKNILQKLSTAEIVHVPIAGNDLSLRAFDNSSKLALSTSVYSGKDYIPKSVRKCISAKAPFANKSFNTYMTVDEHKYQIFLNYLGSFDYFDKKDFKVLLDDFSGLADKWRDYLDEHEKRDLIHINVK